MRRQQLRVAAEQLEKAAKADQDLAKYEACGRAYLDLYNDGPKAAGADDNLYNAGVCFEEARSIGAALQVYATFTKAFPTSKLRPKAIARAAKAYQTIGELAKAAELLEEYAFKYGGERDAFQALSDAMLVRRALGDDDKAIADTKFFIRNFGARQPDAAAKAMYALGPLYAKKSAAAYQQHLREWIRQYGGKDEELRAIALVELGESLWKSACTQPDAEGLCVRVTRERVLPLAARKVKAVAGQKRCGPATTTAVTPIARDAKLVAEAVKALDEGEKAFARLGRSSQQPHALHARAMGQLLLADRQLEEYLAVRFPADLDFTPKTPKAQTSLKRFNEYIAQKSKLGTQVQGKLSAIATFKDAATTVWAMQRLGVMHQTYGLELMNAVIPKDVGSGPYAAEKVEAFCDKMTEVAEPLLKRASEGYDACLSKGSQLGVHDATTRACARDRAALDPTTFALSSEILPPVPLLVPITDEAPIRPRPALPQDVRAALEKLGADYRPTSPLKSCATHLRAFEDLARRHKLADVDATVGFLHGRCGKVEQARAAYQRALQLDPKHAIAKSNLGELEYRAGNLLAAARQWKEAVQLDGKLFGAQVGAASLALADLRTTPKATRSGFAREVERQLKAAAAVGAELSPAPYVLLSLFASEHDQLHLARYYLDFARRIDTSVHGELARAALFERMGGSVLAILDGAATAWPSDDTHFALARHYLALRRHDDAAATLAKIKRTSYDVAIARGIALRGQAKYADAEKRYAEAIVLDAKRPEAHFALGVLWKDYTAARAPNGPAAKAAFKKAADAFRKAGTPDAKALADDCDKAIAALP